MSPTTHIESLTSLRGLAAWLVVAYHVREWFPETRLAPVDSWLAQGYLAVDFFFVLSGFVIGLNYRDITERFSARAYAVFLSRRLGRIYPLHLVLSLVYLVNPITIVLFSRAATVGPRYDTTYYFLSLALMQNWGFTDTLAWNIPAWSISTEWGAYLLFPFLAFGVSRLCNTRAAYVFLGVALTVALTVLYRVTNVASIGDAIPTHGLVRCVVEFTLGIICAQYCTREAAALTHQRLYLLVSATLMTVVGLFTSLPNYFYVPGCFALVVLYVASGRQTGFSLLRGRALVFLGEISYATYLVHYLIKDWIKFYASTIDWREIIVYLVMVLVSSIILYRYVEVPGRRWLGERVALRIAARPSNEAGMA